MYTLLSGMHRHRGLLWNPWTFPHTGSFSTAWPMHGTLHLGIKAVPRTWTSHFKASVGFPQDLQRASFWACFWEGRWVSLYEELITDRSQHPEEQKDNLNHLYNPPLFEALYLIHFAAMLKDRLTMRSQMRMTFPPRTDERNFRIDFSYLSRQWRPCGPVLSHQSHATAGHPWAVKKALLLNSVHSSEHTLPSFMCSPWVLFRGICTTWNSTDTQIHGYSEAKSSKCPKSASKETPNTAKAQPARARRQRIRLLTKYSQIGIFQMDWAGHRKCHKKEIKRKLRFLWGLHPT